METRKQIASEKPQCGSHKRKEGATQCKQLKEIGTGIVLRECTGCVADAAELLEQQLKNLE